MKSRMAVPIVCAAVVLAAVVGGARTQSQESSSPAKWEYRIVSFAELSGILSLGPTVEKIQTVQEMEALNNDMARRMTDFGKQGWELVCVQNDHNYVFKRKMS
jgi:hypothetical protein